MNGTQSSTRHQTRASFQPCQLHLQWLAYLLCFKEIYVYHVCFRNVLMYLHAFAFWCHAHMWDTFDLTFWTYRKRCFEVRQWEEPEPNRFNQPQAQAQLYILTWSRRQPQHLNMILIMCFNKSGPANLGTEKQKQEWTLQWVSKFLFKNTTSVIVLYAYGFW